jgi:hypothetical protein
MGVASRSSSSSGGYGVCCPVRVAAVGVLVRSEGSTCIGCSVVRRGVRRMGSGALWWSRGVGDSGAGPELSYGRSGMVKEMGGGAVLDSVFRVGAGV